MPYYTVFPSHYLSMGGKYNEKDKKYRKPGAALRPSESRSTAPPPQCLPEDRERVGGGSEIVQLSSMAEGR